MEILTLLYFWGVGVGGGGDIFLNISIFQSFYTDKAAFQKLSPKTAVLKILLNINLLHAKIRIAQSVACWD